VTADDHQQSQQITIGGGHAGAVAGPLHFGIAAAKTAVVRVQWPDGSLSDMGDVMAGETILIEQPD